MMFGLDSFNLINEFERAFNESNESSSRIAQLSYNPTHARSHEEEDLLVRSNKKVKVRDTTQDRPLAEVEMNFLPKKNSLYCLVLRGSTPSPGEKKQICFELFLIISLDFFKKKL